MSHVMWFLISTALDANKGTSYSNWSWFAVHPKSKHTLIICFSPTLYFTSVWMLSASSFFRISSGSYAIFLPSMDPFDCENKYFFSSDLYFHGNSYERCLSTRASVSLWSSSAHYVTLQVGTSKVFGKFVASRHLVKKRQVNANLHYTYSGNPIPIFT